MDTRTEIQTKPSRVRQNLDKRGGIAQCEIHALTGNRMHAMRGITDEDEAMRNELPRHNNAQRP